MVLAAVRVYHRLAPASWANRYIGPLLRLLQAPPELQAVVLANVALIAASRPVSQLSSISVLCPYHMRPDSLTRCLPS